MDLDHDFVQVWKFSEDQKNANETLFPPNSGEDQKKKSSSKIEHFSRIFAQMYTHSNYWGGYTQIIGGIYPHPPPLVSAPLVEIPHKDCRCSW